MHVIHEQIEQKIPPMKWATQFACNLSFIIIGIATVFMPFYLVATFGHSGFYFILLLAPLGIWLAVSLGKQLPKLIWDNTHLDEAALFQDQIRLVNWKKNVAQPRQETSLSFSDIDYAVVTFYLSKHTGNNQALYPQVIFVQKRHNRLAYHTVRFLDDDGINHWLLTTQEKQIPLYFSATMPVTFTEEEMQVFLQSDQELMPFTLEKSWLVEDAKIVHAWDEFYYSEDDTDFQKETEDGLSPQPKILTKENYEKKQEAMEQSEAAIKNSEKKKRLHQTDFINIGYILATLFILAVLAKLDIINEYSSLYGHILIVTLSFLYFNRLREQLSALYIIRFWIFSGALLFVVGVIVAEIDDTIFEVTMNYLLASLLSLAYLWIPFFITNALAKKDQQHTNEE